MAQRTADREATPFSTDPAAELPVGVQLSWRLRALIATGRLAAGRAAAELPPPRRVGGRQRQHRARGLRRARGGRAGGQPAGPGHLRRRADRGLAGAGGDRRRRTAAGARRRARTPATWSSSPPPARAWAVARNGRERRRAARSCRGERGDRGAPRAAPPDRPAGDRAGRLHARPARRHADRGPLLQSPHRRRRGARADAGHLDRPALGGAAGGRAARRQVGEARARRKARLEEKSDGSPVGRGPSGQGDELVAGASPSAGLRCPSSPPSSRWAR